MQAEIADLIERYNALHASDDKLDERVWKIEQRLRDAAAAEKNAAEYRWAPRNTTGCSSSDEASPGSIRLGGSR